MAATAASRTVKESRVRMTEIVLPEDSNVHGSIFGGRVLALVDKCASVVALRHARCHVLTARLDSVDFHNPVRVGDILILNGWINAAFGSSMEIEVEVAAENPLTGAQTVTTRAFVTMVAVGADGKPAPVPPLELVGAEQKRRAAAAVERRRRRLSARQPRER